MQTTLLKTLFVALSGISAVYAEEPQYAHDDATMEIRFNTENSRACIRRDIKEFPILIRYITTDIKISNDRNDQAFGISVIEYKGSVVEVVRGTLPADKPIMIWTAMGDEVTNPSLYEQSKGRARYCFAKGYTRQEDGTLQLVEPSILPKRYEGTLKQVLQEQ